jgi:hypothetical protein
VRRSSIFEQVPGCTCAMEILRRNEEKGPVMQTLRESLGGV